MLRCTADGELAAARQHHSGLRITDALLQVEAETHDLHCSPPLPGQPGTSLLSLTQYIGGEPVSIVYSSALQPLYSWQSQRIRFHWAPDRSALGLLTHSYWSLPGLEVWQLPGQHSSAALQTSQQAAACLAQGSAILEDWAWSCRSSLLIVVHINGQYQALAWHPDGARMLCAAPRHTHSVVWSPTGQQLMLQNQEQMTLHCAHSGAGLLHIVKDAGSLSEACMCVLLALCCWLLRLPQGL